MNNSKKRVSIALGLALLIMPNVPLMAKEPTTDQKRVEQETLMNTQYLLGHVLKKTKKLQQGYGDFSPYGAALFKNGVVKYVWYSKPGEIAKKPMDTLPVIRQALQTQALEGKIVGSAVVYKVKDEGGQFQLNVELEYQTGLALAFASEVSLDANNHVVWGNNAQTHYTPKVFTTSGLVEGAVVSDLVSASPKTLSE